MRKLKKNFSNHLSDLSSSLTYNRRLSQLVKHGRYGLQTYLANTDMDHISAVVLMMQLIQKTQLLSPLGLPSYLSSSSSSIKAFHWVVHKQRKWELTTFSQPFYSVRRLIIKGFSLCTQPYFCALLEYTLFMDGPCDADSPSSLHFSFDAC